MAIRVSQILGAIVLLGVCFALPQASHASLISFGSEMSSHSPVARAQPQAGTMHPPRARNIADARLNHESDVNLDALQSPSSGASGAGSGVPQVSGSTASCALTESTVFSVNSSWGYRVFEAAIIVSSPALDGMLRPPRA
jgi:hypothetical protein